MRSMSTSKSTDGRTKGIWTYSLQKVRKKGGKKDREWGEERGW